MLARLRHPRSIVTPLRATLTASALASLSLAALFSGASELSTPVRFVQLACVALSACLPTTMFVGVRRSAGAAMLRASLGGLSGGLLAACLAFVFWLRAGDPSTEALVLASVLGLALGVVVGPVYALLHYPLLVATVRAREHETREAPDACVAIAGGWLFVFCLGIAAITTRTTHPRWAWLSLGIGVVGLLAALRAVHRVRSVRVFLARVRAGMEPAYRVLAKRDVKLTSLPAPLMRAGFDATAARYDGVLVLRGDDYRSSDEPLAAVPLTQDPSFGSLAVYFEYPAGKRGGGRIGVLIVLTLAFLVGAAFTFLKLR